MGDWSPSESTVAAVAALASLITAALAYWTIRVTAKSSKQSGLSVQISNITKFLNDEYFDKSIETNRYKDEFPSISQGPTQKLRIVRGEVERSLYRSKHAPAAYQEFCEKSCDLDSSEYTWQNYVAYEMCVGLENVGAAVLLGAIPLEAVVGVGGATILRDWELCFELVNTVRGRLEVRRDVAFGARGSVPVHFHRRHAEWLAMATAVYFLDRWPASSALPLFWERTGLLPVEAWLREKAIRQVELSDGILKRPVDTHIRQFLYGMEVNDRSPLWVGSE